MNRTRLRVVEEISSTHAEIQAARALVDEAIARYERMKRLSDVKAVEDNVVGESLSRLLKTKADLAVKETKLPYLLGKQSVVIDANLGYYPPGLALIVRGKSGMSAAISDEEFLRRATLDLHGRVPTVDEMKAFLKMPENDRRAKWIEQQSRMGRDSIWIDYGFPIYMSPDGKRYQALVAPHILDFHTRLSRTPDSPLTEKLRKALDAPVSLTLLMAKPPDLMKTTRDDVLGGDINIIVRIKTWKKDAVNVILPKKVPAGAMLQFLEDELDIVFVLRDYGIVVVAADEKLPPGAVRVLDFWKYGKALEPAEGLKEKTLAPKGKPVPDGVRGVIEKVDPKDARLVQISIGSDAGLVQGQHLNLFRRAAGSAMFLPEFYSPCGDVMSARSVA